ncbi:RadC family protein [Candidatus Hydrogenosomobacter endosymbioticus]|uniref:DNA repair protein RadC n=1 Tax=Candidatus Hydrogenosomobacter endosymbioticus TaxID=2558174 RepID=A0ABN6L3C9_9PROT|nr:DNA repair protein RadC [Candidatus Hydrogenosomobacter endosymbioticus]BDB96393.1 DNA repair protein RadC [Candidatus Hydrogenosomobacter endosymbioticus]
MTVSDVCNEVGGLFADQETPGHGDISEFGEATLFPVARSQKKPHYLGHRRRLRERFLKAPRSVPDYEVLEMALYLAYPRKDVKPLAKDLLDKFGSLQRVVSASIAQLHELGATGAAPAFALLKELSRRLAEEEIRSAPLLNNSERVVNYCRITMAHLPVEQFCIMFLDKKYYLISDEAQSLGTIDQTSLYPREVMKRALELNAVGVIMVHNHPSGDPSPSNADIEITKLLSISLAAAGIKILDHFIIGKYAHFSFRENALLPV